MQLVYKELCHRVKKLANFPIYNDGRDRDKKVFVIIRLDPDTIGYDNFHIRPDPDVIDSRILNPAGYLQPAGFRIFII